MIFYRSYKPSNVEPTFDLDEFSFTSQDTLKTRVKRFLQRNSKNDPDVIFCAEA